MHYYLYFRPRPVPKWWPRQGRRPVWVGALGGSAWVAGQGNRFQGADLRETVAELRLEYQNPEFKKEKA